jgi:hypothetical protein
MADVTLTEEERAHLTYGWRDDSTSRPLGLIPTVERIVAARVAAAELERDEARAYAEVESESRVALANRLIQVGRECDAWKRTADERSTVAVSERVATEALERAALTLDRKATEWADEYAASNLDADYGRWDAWENAARIVRDLMPRKDGE